MAPAQGPGTPLKVCHMGVETYGDTPSQLDGLLGKIIKMDDLGNLHMLCQCGNNCVAPMLGQSHMMGCPTTNVSW